MCKICTSLKQPYVSLYDDGITWEIYSVVFMCIGCALEICIWLLNKVFCNIHIVDTIKYLNSRCNTAKLLWVVTYVVRYGWFSPDLVVMNICRQRLIKVDCPLRRRSLANENAVVCWQRAMRWRVWNALLLESWCCAYAAVSCISCHFLLLKIYTVNMQFIRWWRHHILYSSIS